MSISHYVTPKRVKAAKQSDSDPVASRDEKVAPTRGKIDDDVLKTFTPEGKSLARRVIESTDLIVVVERAQQPTRIRKPRRSG